MPNGMYGGMRGGQNFPSTQFISPKNIHFYKLKFNISLIKGFKIDGKIYFCIYVFSNIFMLLLKRFFCICFNAYLLFYCVKGGKMMMRKYRLFIFNLLKTAF